MAERLPAREPSSPLIADPTLLDALAALTPEERLRWNDRMACTVLELRHAFATQPDHAPRPAGRERD